MHELRQLGELRADGCGQILPQWQSVLDGPVRVVEKLDYVHAAVEHGVADLDVGLGSRNARPPATDGRLLAMPWPGSSSSRPTRRARAVIGLPPEQEQTR